MLSFSVILPKIEKLTTFEKKLNYESSWCFFFIKKNINNGDNNRKFHLNQGQIEMSFNVTKLFILLSTLTR